MYNKHIVLKHIFLRSLNISQLHDLRLDWNINDLSQCWRENKLHWATEEMLCWSSLCTFLSQFSHSVMSNSLRPHGLQHTRPPCLSPTLGVYSNSCPLSWWCHPTISSSVVPFFSCLQSYPASGSFPMSQLLASGGQSIGVSASASVLPDFL